jgi:hypothetical protein
MALSSILKLTRFIVPLIITSLLVSCATSQHAGVTTISEPTFETDNESTGFLYYQDQFDAKEGNVVLPPDQYPQASIRPYQRARVDWDQKKQQAKVKTIAAYTGISVSTAIFFYLIYTAVFPISAPAFDFL